MAAQAGLCLTWSETPKTGFLVTRRKFFFFSKINEDNDDDLDTTESKETGCYETKVVEIQANLTSCLRKNSRILRNAFLLMLLLLYFAFFGYSLYYRFGDEGTIFKLCVIPYLFLYTSRGRCNTEVKK